MVYLTISEIPGYTYKVIGMVHGSSVQSVHIGKDIKSSFKNLVGGELTSYTEVMDKALHEATRRMGLEAEKLGADAVVGVRFTTSSVSQNAAEYIAYGTAVQLVRK